MFAINVLLQQKQTLENHCQPMQNNGFRGGVSFNCCSPKQALFIRVKHVDFQEKDQ